MCYSSDGCHTTDGHKLPEPSEKRHLVFVLEKFEGAAYEHVVSLQKENKFLFGYVKCGVFIPGSPSSQTI